MLLLYLLIAVPVVLAMVVAARRRNRAGASSLSARDARELQASRELIDRLLAGAIDHRDVDPVFSPIVIDEIRTHQRRLSDPRDNDPS